MKEDFSDEDGIRAANLEANLAETWRLEAEPEASFLSKAKHSRKELPWAKKWAN